MGSKAWLCAGLVLVTGLMIWGGEARADEAAASEDLPPPVVRPVGDIENEKAELLPADDLWT